MSHWTVKQWSDEAAATAQRLRTFTARELANVLGCELSWARDFLHRWVKMGEVEYVRGEPVYRWVGAPSGQRLRRDKGQAGETAPVDEMGPLAP